ncbi:unnamed protein product, partial [Ascophyllum nodosum]
NIKHQAASLVDVGCSSLGETEDILPFSAAVRRRDVDPGEVRRGCFC